MLREGSTVSYVGYPRDGVAIGDSGQVLSLSSPYCHVTWLSGSRVGQVDLLPEDDFVVLGRGGRQATVSEALDDSLDLPHLSAQSARAVFDAEGPDGVLAALFEDGTLGSLSEAVEQAVGTVIESLRRDEGVVTVLSALDSDEADAVVLRATAMLFRDALGDGDDG